MIKNVLEYLKKILWIMSRKQRALGGILVVLVLLCAGMQIVSVYVVAPLVTAMTNRELFINTRVVRIIATILNVGDYEILFFAFCICIAVVYFVKEILSLFQTWFSIKFSQKIQRDLSKEVFDSYMSREYDFFLDYGTAKIMRDVNDDPNSVYNMLVGFINVFAELLTSFLLLLYVILSDYEMAICMALLTMVSLFILTFGLKRKLLRKGEESRKRLAEKQKVLLEAVEGIKEVQVMKKQKNFVDSFFESCLRAQKPLVFQSMAITAPTNIVEGVFVIGIVMFMGVKSLSDANFWNKLPVLASFLVAAIRMLPSIGRITNNINNIQFYVPSLNSVYNNIKIIRNEVNDYNNADSGDILEFNNRIVLKDITYHYKDSDKNILDNLNLTIRKGESVGIIGHSGSGKSTLADLILGLHIPQQGCISMDGVDIQKIPYEYSRVIGYVPQNAYLVDGTIKENVAFGVEKNQISEEDVIASLKKAKLYDFVMETEKGLDTIIGERGIKFSGGQRQRLAIARALYRKPQVLILDEATSALDNSTEMEVMKQVEEMQGDVTLVIIAHRLSTIEKCDAVYEIVNGKAVIVKQ